MSKVNIQGIIDNIRSKSNVYTPIIEAVVNSIDSIISSKISNGEITILIKREHTLNFEDSLPSIRSIEIHDNGIGFTPANRDSFDTLYSVHKKEDFGGKGFGRFMYLKYFSEAKIESNYKNGDGKYQFRTFSFGRKNDIIINETFPDSTQENSFTVVYLNNLLKDKNFDKELETIARKLLEKLLIFFINDNFICPKIILKESDDSHKIVLNEYLKADNEIKLIKSKPFKLKCTNTDKEHSFTAKVFKIFFSKTDSKIILTANNREVTESSLHNYIPEFEDEFFDEINKGNKVVKKNYIIKTYVLGKYLDSNVSLERESFNFDKDKTDDLYIFSQIQIEKEAAIITKDIFDTEVKLRIEKKQKRIYEYVNEKAPWHKTYIADVDFSSFAYNANEEKIELELQKFKFNQEQENLKDMQFLINSTEEEEFNKRINDIMTKVSDIAKSDLAHYVCSRKIVLQIFEELRKRDDEGKASLEKEIHSLIYPMNRDSTNTTYQQHNLWLLDERLVFSEYVASDRKISRNKDAFTEPDLLIFNKKNSYRTGDNEYSNPITIFEFKQPKRKNYSQDEDPVLQIGNYLEKIRQGKYEMPEGLEKIKVNESTPVYAYVICDIETKIIEFARNHSLIPSADREGYFGFHPGFRMYIEIISFKKLLKDATLRNKIFFKKLQID